MGKLPLSLLELTSKLVNWFNRPKEDGISPPKVLPERWILVKRERFPSEEGIKPLKLESWSLKTFRCLRLLIEFGILPEKDVRERSKYARELFPLNSGRGPSSF